MHVNFFKYTREHYNLDRLIDYRTEVISDPLLLVNPAYRQLDGQVRSCTGKLTRRLAEFGEMTLKEGGNNEEVEAFVVKKAACRDDIEQLQHQCHALKKERKQTAHHITMAELPEEARFKQLSTSGKHLVDTIKMTAYRAETAMANILRQTLSHQDESRTLLEALFKTEADIIPDEQAGTLTVSVHHLANRSSDAAIEKLCEELNQTETIYPGTELRLILKLGST
jgi:hypothetical protein